MNKYKLLARLSATEIAQSKFKNIMGLLIGQNVINNPNTIRKEDIETGDIIFYEGII